MQKLDSGLWLRFLLSNPMSSTEPGDIDAYIAAFPPEVQKSLQKIRALIREAAPDAVEAMKYRIPTFVLGTNLVHFAAYQNHIGFYPTPSTITAFASELRDFVSAKGSVQFPLNRPIPFGLIRRMVEFRVVEVHAKKKPSGIKKSRPASRRRPVQ